LRKKTLVYNKGVNDADYLLVKYKQGSKKIEWICPYYKVWKPLIQRCYSDKYQKDHPTYKDCTVCEEWLTFSNFKDWMEQQDWQDKELDKDLAGDSKTYSPETCKFISRELNLFLTDVKRKENGLPTGVHIKKGKTSKIYAAQCNNPQHKRTCHIGYFESPNKAEIAYLKKKVEYAKTMPMIDSEEFLREIVVLRYQKRLDKALQEGDTNGNQGQEEEEDAGEQSSSEAHVQGQQT
jgi:hypothetical protein